MSKTHNGQILELLKRGESITPIDALQMFGCFRLGARIFDLRHGKYDGVKYDIEEISEKRDGKRYARYRMRPSLMFALLDAIPDPIPQHVEKSPTQQARLL
jgi:hypothetical protein